jgi:hypothetical protein
MQRARREFVKQAVGAAAPGYMRGLLHSLVA